MRIRCRTKFLLHRRHPRQEGNVPIRMRVTLAGQRPFDIPTGWTVDPGLWDGERHRAQPHLADLNRALEECSQAVEKACARFELVDERVPSAEELREEINRVMGRSLVDREQDERLQAVFADFLREVQKESQLATSTVGFLKVTAASLENFDPKAKMSDVTDEWCGRWLAALSEKHKNTTTNIRIASFRWFLRWASRKGRYAGRSHETFRPRIKGTKRDAANIVYLTQEELARIRALDLSGPKSSIEVVRDAFVFACFSGLRFSDVSKLAKSDVKADVIEVVTQKTRDPLRIDLNTASRAILKKYAQSPGEKVFPLPKRAQVNILLKEIAHSAGIDEPHREVYFVGSERREIVRPKWKCLSFHAARRTFVVSALRLGIPAEVIMRWTGHSNFDALRPYVKIVDELKRENMARFDRLDRDTILYTNLADKGGLR